MDSLNDTAVAIPDNPMLFPLAAAILIFTSVGGLVANVFLCHLVATTQTLRTHINAYAINMAVGDLLCATVSTPLRIATFTIDPALNARVIFTLCRTCVFLRTLVDAVRLMILSGLGYERYQAVANPFSRDPTTAVRRLKILTALFWTLSLASASTAAAFFTDSALLYHCHPDGDLAAWGDLDVYVILPVTVVVISLIFICYALIIRILIRHSDTMKRYFSRKNAVAPVEKVPSQVPVKTQSHGIDQGNRSEKSTLGVLGDGGGQKAKSGAFLEVDVRSVFKQKNQDLNPKIGNDVVSNQTELHNRKEHSNTTEKPALAVVASFDNVTDDTASPVTGKQLKEAPITQSANKSDIVASELANPTDKCTPPCESESTTPIPPVAKHIPVSEAASEDKVSNTSSPGTANGCATVTNTQNSLANPSERNLKATEVDSTGRPPSAWKTAPSSPLTIRSEKPTSSQRIQVVEMDGSAHSETVAMGDATVVGAVCKFDIKNREKGKRRVEVRAAKRIAILTGVFVCLALPFKVIVILSRHNVDFMNPTGMYGNLVLCFAAIETLTVILDPVLYCLVNKPVKAAAGRKIRGWFRRR